mgnify:CR=1 FL=1
MSKTANLFTKYIEDMGLYFGNELYHGMQPDVDPSYLADILLELEDFFQNINRFFWEEIEPTKVGETPEDCTFELTKHGRDNEEGMKKVFEEMLLKLAEEGKVQAPTPHLYLVKD